MTTRYTLQKKKKAKGHLMISENVLALAERTRKKSSPGKFYLKGINFREFCAFLPKLQNLILAKIMKISKFPKFFSSKIHSFLNFLFIQDSQTRVRA